jgi:SAM-dependent methyltransferase
MRAAEPPANDLLRAETRVLKQGNLYIDVQWSPSGVTDQFLADADTYHERYANRLDFEALLDHCLTLASIDRAQPTRVLDIGSGGGSSVFATASLLPAAHVVASDISPQLLGKLADFVASKPELRSRVSSFCFDLHVPFFREETFDLVLGTAILHHLLDPVAALKNVAHALRKGGRIILVEPLEAGWLVNTIIYDLILKELGRRQEVNSPLAHLMRAMRLDIQARLGCPAAKPWTPHLDDKWVFNEAYWMDLSEQLGCSEVSVYPAQEDVSRLYEGGFRSLLADSGNRGVAIPDEILSILRRFDSGMSRELKEVLSPTGIVVMRK